MKAVGYTHNLPSDDPRALIDLELPSPVPGAHDLQVRVQAVSVNPVDTKVRRKRPASEVSPQVLGWDAVGTVLEVGSAVQGFRPGDRVWYAGAIDRPGSNAEQQLVDARIVAKAPSRLSDAEAAALPLTTITAWELLFDRLQVPRAAPQPQSAGPAALLITGGAGGVGSILIQLARQLTDLTIVATASRPSSREWCLALGVHHVIDHREPFVPQLQALALPPLRYAASLTHTPQHYAQLVEALAPQGRLALIDDFEPGDIDVMALKGKCLSLHWEMMFARSLHQTPDMAEQGRLLGEVAALVEAGRVRSTLSDNLGPINAANLRRAHALVESGQVQGKLVLQGFGD
ncbi:zinc-binding alcohol dehydrogenase family protein [Caldimonas brevitalea]|uniref:Zinc-type alcohol dehydrogenase-like protein n=1 Tax=Caldimonas brevitalea TaxID=413882 RepID=A0A0G3BVC3_9BURK|nr:zinc-binding alcohol dehydrogenase family protein [Caldimonas brevitalea]AKJ31316.1 NADPH:quinone reductase [Caldimonas brevitalea]